MVSDVDGKGIGGTRDGLGTVIDLWNCGVSGEVSHCAVPEHRLCLIMTWSLLGFWMRQRSEAFS